MSLFSCVLQKQNGEQKATYAIQAETNVLNKEGEHLSDWKQNTVWSGVHPANAHVYKSSW